MPQWGIRLNDDDSLRATSKQEISIQMNELPVIGYPHYAQRTLGSPGGKHDKSLRLEGNVWRKSVFF